MVLLAPVLRANNHFPIQDQNVLACVRVRIAPLPIVRLLTLAGMIPFVILDVPRFQIAVPCFVFGIFPFMFHGVILSGQSRDRCKQT